MPARNPPSKCPNCMQLSAGCLCALAGWVRLCVDAGLFWARGIAPTCLAPTVHTAGDYTSHQQRTSHIQLLCHIIIQPRPQRRPGTGREFNVAQARHIRTRRLNWSLSVYSVCLKLQPVMKRFRARALSLSLSLSLSPAPFLLRNPRLRSSMVRCCWHDFTMHVVAHTHDSERV